MSTSYVKASQQGELLAHAADRCLAGSNSLHYSERMQDAGASGKQLTLSNNVHVMTCSRDTNVDNNDISTPAPAPPALSSVRQSQNPSIISTASAVPAINKSSWL
jgi:hypothetical protein